MTTNVIHWFYPKFLYKESTYCIYDLGHTMLMIHHYEKTTNWHMEDTSVGDMTDLPLYFVDRLRCQKWSMKS